MQRVHSLSNMTVTQGEALEWGRRTYVMGVINVTPDSFSGDGLGSDIQAIVELALRFEEEGADMIDVGAESTRPGSSPVSVDEELARLVPALEAISGRIRVPISVDTYKSQVARHALLESGAMIVNDVWGLKADQDRGTCVAKMPGWYRRLKPSADGFECRSAWTHISRRWRVTPCSRGP